MTTNVRWALNAVQRYNCTSLESSFSYPPKWYFCASFSLLKFPSLPTLPSPLPAFSISVPNPYFLFYSMMQPHFCHSCPSNFIQDRTCNTSEWNLGLSELVCSKKSIGHFKTQDTVDLIMRTSLPCSSSQSFQLHSEVWVLPSLKLSCQWAASSWEGGIDCCLTHVPSPSLLDACLLLTQGLGVEEQRELENSPALWAWPAFKAIMSSSESSHSWRSLSTVPLFGVICSPPARLPTHFLPQPWEPEVVHLQVLSAEGPW